MKCLICGGKTLTGAKLCHPCRAALRRARDDTISELLPLPRRREAMAYASATSVAGALPLDSATIVLAPPRRRRRPVPPLRRLTPRHFRMAALASFVVAAGLLAFVGVHEMQRERDTAGAVPAAAAPPVGESHAVVPRVSPSTLLGTARDENAPAPDVPLMETPESPPVAAAAAAPARAADKPARSRSATARTPLPVEAPPAVVPEPPPVVIRMAPPLPAPAPRAATADRGQFLATALARCGGDFLARTVCEHRARAQHCDGQWGQLPLCPAGVANDHGQ